MTLELRRVSNMFIFVTDRKLAERLVEKGFVVIRRDSKGTTFAPNKEINFDFSKVDKEKFIFTNRLYF